MKRNSSASILKRKFATMAGPTMNGSVDQPGCAADLGAFRIEEQPPMKRSASLQFIQRLGAIAGFVENLSDEHAAEDIELRVPVRLVANPASHLHVRFDKARIMAEKHTRLGNQK